MFDDTTLELLQLRAENERLRAALMLLVQDCESDEADGGSEFKWPALDAARAALGGAP